MCLIKSLNKAILFVMILIGGKEKLLGNSFVFDNSIPFKMTIGYSTSATEIKCIIINLLYEKEFKFSNKRVVKPFVVFKFFYRGRIDPLIEIKPTDFELNSLIPFSSYLSDKIIPLLAEDMTVNITNLRSPVLYTYQVNSDTFTFKYEGNWYRVTDKHIQEYFNISTYTQDFAYQSSGSLINLNAISSTVSFHKDSYQDSAYFLVNNELPKYHNLYLIKKSDSAYFFIKNMYLGGGWNDYILFEFNPKKGVTMFRSKYISTQNTRIKENKAKPLNVGEDYLTFRLSSF